jgi:hypothetical protein
VERDIRADKVSTGLMGGPKSKALTRGLTFLSGEPTWEDELQVLEMKGSR